MQDKAQPATQPNGEAAAVARASSGLTWGPLAVVAFWMLVMGALYVAMDYYLKPKPVSITASGDLVIPKARDGHFYALGSVNGQSVTFMVDTGASLVTTSEEFARNAGVAAGIPTVFRTANGDLKGRIVHDVPVTLGPITVSGVRVGVGLVGGDADAALLGQSFLAKFDVMVTKDQMVLRPR